MTKLSIVVAMDEKQGIGRDNRLLCHLPADLKFFKQTTMGKPIIMGRKTYDSIGKPLPGRQNIVISRNAQLSIDGVDVVASLAAAIEMLDVEEAMIIGGASIYQQALSLCDSLYITRIHHHFAADTFFPSVDWQQWQILSSDDYAKDEKNAHDMTFEHWQRAN